MRNLIKKLDRWADNSWDRIEDGMDYINKNGVNWILKNELFIYIATALIALDIFLFCIPTKGLAPGGEAFLPLIPWIVISYIKMVKGDDEDGK